MKRGREKMKIKHSAIIKLTERSKTDFSHRVPGSKIILQIII